MLKYSGRWELDRGSHTKLGGVGPVGALLVPPPSQAPVAAGFHLGHQTSTPGLRPWSLTDSPVVRIHHREAVQEGGPAMPLDLE